MRNDPFTLPAFAKINWLLKILGKRTDGYHELCTVFQTISLFDELTFSPADEFSFGSNAEALVDDPGNLVVEAAKLLRERFRVTKGADIYLKKKIPFPGGLGGGSSNAAICLLGLAKLWELAIRSEELLEIGALLGSDVPFFFYGGTAMGTGRGTEIESIAEVSEKRLLIVTPPISVSTAIAFERLGLPSLTNTDSESNLRVCRERAKRLDLRLSELTNDFELTVFEIAPSVRFAKEKLFDYGAVNALLCGSGSSVFGIFENDETRQTAMRSLASETDWELFAVATISRKEFRDALSACEKLLPRFD